MGDSAQPGAIETFTASDGYRWRYRHFVPEGSPRAHVVCIHGIQSHGGWYTYSCGKLCDAGFTVWFLDRRGSGLNQQDRGDTPNDRRLIDDVAEFLRTLRPAEAKTDRVPIFLVAISWGGKLATALQQEYPSLIDGLALLCPGFFPQFKPSLKQFLSVGLSFYLAPRKMFPVPLTTPELFTATPHWRQFIAEDPLMLRDGTARLAVMSRRYDRRFRKKLPFMNIPVLLMLAEHDRIIHNQRTRQFVEQFAQGDKTIIEYPGAHHTLEFEPDPDRFIQDLREWLERHRSSSPTVK